MLQNILIVRPVGGNCNLKCTYCFYDYEHDRPIQIKKVLMSDDVLEKTISQHMRINKENVSFCWHGGEPTTAGKDFFEKVLLYENKYLHQNQAVYNSIQTNAVLIDDWWAKTFKKFNFQVGVSLDGPEFLHDYYRVNYAQRGTFKSVIKGMEKLKEHGVSFGIFTVINNINKNFPKEMFEFYLNINANEVSFNPCTQQSMSFDRFVGPSINQSDYWDFISQFYDLWLEHGKPFHVRLFELMEALKTNPSRSSSLCWMNNQCSSLWSIEPNGDVFLSCSHHFGLKLGNILEKDLVSLYNSETYKSKEKETHPNHNLSGEWSKHQKGGCLLRSIKRNNQWEYTYGEFNSKLFDKILGVKENA